MKCKSTHKRSVHLNVRINLKPKLYSDSIKNSEYRVKKHEKKRLHRFDHDFQTFSSIAIRYL